MGSSAAASHPGDKNSHYSLRLPPYRVASVVPMTLSPPSANKELLRHLNPFREASPIGDTGLTVPTDVVLAAAANQRRF